MLTSLRTRRAVAEMAVHGIREGAGRRIPLDRREHACAGAARRVENPPHLPDRGRPVGEELETELAEHDVELAIAERQTVCPPLVPPDPSTFGCRARRP